MDLSSQQGQTSSANNQALFLPLSLLQLLSNSLILYHTVPLLPVSSLLALGATSKPFKGLIHDTPGVFRHLNLSNVKSARSELGSVDLGGEVWRNVQLDENVTEDDFYGGPLRGIFTNLQRRNILKDVQTLVLDGLAVPSDLVADIISDTSYNVRVLSIREVQHLNEHKLQQALMYAIRPSRAENTPRLHTMYIFGPKDALPIPRAQKHKVKYPAGIDPSYGGVTSSLGAQIGAEWNQRSGHNLAEELRRTGDKWFQASGKLFARQPSPDWASILLACRGIINFDAVLCSGPRHSSSTAPYNLDSKHLPVDAESRLFPRIATHALGGCYGCGSAPERFAIFGQSPLQRFPALAPLHLHASTEKATKSPINNNTVTSQRLLARCSECLMNRFCEGCLKWWCENCYEVTTNTIAPSTEWDVDNQAVVSVGDAGRKNVKVYMGLCIEQCLVAEMMMGAGSNGMWG